MISRVKGYVVISVLKWGPGSVTMTKVESEVSFNDGSYSKGQGILDERVEMNGNWSVRTDVNRPDYKIAGPDGLILLAGSKLITID